MIVARTVGGPGYLKRMEEMDRELVEVIEDFDRSVNVEALHLAKRSGRHSLFQSGESPFSLFSCRESRTREESESEKNESEQNERD